MNISRHIVPILLALLAGCAVGPDFKTPQPVVPPQWSDTATAATSTTTAQPQTWWTNFNDPLLASLIERAQQANLDLRQSLLRMAEARAQRDITAAQRWPRLSINTAYQRQRLSENTPTGALLGAAGSFGGPAGLNVANPYNQYQLGFDASWELDLFGRVRRFVEAADADVQASIEDSRAVLISLCGDVARTYVELRGAQLRLAITRDQLATQRELFDLTQQRQSAGLASELDVSNAAALVAMTEAQVPTLERQITLAINQLSQLIGREPDTLRSELTIAAAIPPVPPEVPLDLPADLARRRPDIRRAEARLHAATARVGVAVADLFPRLTLSTDVGLQAQDVSNLTDWASRFFVVGPRLDLPIFSGGQRRANVQLQDVRAREAATDYARTVLTALHEVENSIVAYGSEQRRRRSLQDSVDHSRDSVQLARQRYESGISSFIDVLDAERNLQQSELQLADSTTAVSTNLIALYKAMGGLDH
jgi:multidrug efflux system outer membrane protein